MQLVAACGLWCLVFKLSVWCGTGGCVSGLRAAARKLYNTFELLMMGIMVPPKHVEQVIRSAIKNIWCI
jgi:hypothetical protein